MDTSWKQTLVQSGLATVIAINMMLGALLFAKEWIVPETVQPTTGLPKSTPSTDYSLELVKVSQSGEWRVEHYQKVEHVYNEQKKRIKQTPTSEMVYLRYWKGSRNE